MHFKAESKPKATLEIGSNTYKITAPLVGQTASLSEALSAEPSLSKQNLMTKQFMCDLGQIPMAELEKLDQDLFNQLFDFIVSSKKN